MSQASTALSADERKQQPKKSFAIDDFDRFVRGAAEIGEIIGKNQSQTFYLLKKGHIDADRVGGRWRSTPRRLLKPVRQAVPAE